MNSPPLAISTSLSSGKAQGMKNQLDQAVLPRAWHYFNKSTCKETLKALLCTLESKSKFGEELECLRLMVCMPIAEVNTPY